MTEEKVIVVLTALNLEYEAVRNHLSDTKIHRHPTGTRFEIGAVPGTDSRIALTLTGVGNQSSAVLAERAIQQFAPMAVLFVGVAGALWDTPNLGDVVIASRVYAYHGGTSEDDGLKSRPRAWEAPHGINQLAQQLARSSDWKKRLPPGSGDPKACFGAIAAGEIVQNSRISHEAQWIRRHYNDAIAIEMEAGGVAQAGHLNGADVAIVRGISDRANGTKSSDGDVEWQPRAAANAAAFAIQLAQQLTDERAETGMASHEHTPGTRSAAPEFMINYSQGITGIQAVEVTNALVHISTGSADASAVDLVAAVAALHRQLSQARDDGEVDDDTFNAAQEQLRNANAALDESGSTRKTRLLLALKQFSGLAVGTTQAAAGVAGLIEAVKGLS